MPQNKTFDTGFEERFVFIHTSMRVFALYFFFEGGGGEGVGVGFISAEINYQLLFLISLSFSKIYYTLSYISINSQTFANPERIVYTWILSNSCSDNKCTSFMY